MKNIKDSETRLQAIELLHNVYNKMIHVLRNDSLFYEVILKSLEKDIEDQQTFVTHIIQTTQPAIHKKKELMSHYEVILPIKPISYLIFIINCIDFFYSIEFVGEPPTSTKA